MDISLMTISIFGELFFKYQIDKDFDGLEETYEEMLDLVKECGYTKLDVTSFETQVFGADAVMSKLTARGLQVSSYIYLAELAAHDEAGFAQRIADAKAAADTAVCFGTDILMLAPQAHAGIENDTPEVIHSSLVENFIPVVEYARESGLHVVVEDTPDLRLHLCSEADLRDILNRVPELEVVYDSGNVVLAREDPVKYFNAFRESIAHVHLKDMQEADPKAYFADHDIDGRAMTGAPTGTGLIDLEGVIDAIKASGYDGGITIEFAVDEERDYRGTMIRSREFVERRI